MFNLKNSKGFTIIELAVVAAIIGVLASVVLASMSTTKVKARNVRRLENVASYRTAFEHAQDKDNEYPDTGSTGYFCLGDYSDDRCWTNGTGQMENASLNTNLLRFLPTLPAIEGVVGSWEGMVYRCSVRNNNQCSTYEIRWYMEGANQSCAGEKTLDPNYNSQNVTLCSMTRTN